MGFRGTLRLVLVVLLIRTWLAESGNRRVASKKRHEVRAKAPKDFKDRYRCNKCANETVINNVLERLMSTYDNRLRPNFGGAPVPVGVSLYVTNIKDISEDSLDYTISLYLHQTWKDPRLAYHETSLNLTLNYQMLTKLWIPDCYFVNSRNSFVHPGTTENRMFQLQPDGTVRYGLRLTTTVPCNIDLKNYPLDKQACKLEVESYAYSNEDVILYWEGDDEAVQVSGDLIIPQFTFLGRKLTHREPTFYTGSYMRLVMTFWVQRSFSGYILHIYWPIVLLTITSWLAFWMNCDCSSARVTLGLSSTLILNTLSTYVRENLPQITCIKAIDVYMAVCFFLVILSLMEYVYINYVYYSRRSTRRHNRRRRRVRRVMARCHLEEQYKQKTTQEMKTIRTSRHIPGPCDDLPSSPSPPRVIVHPRPNSDDSKDLTSSSNDDSNSPASAVRQAKRGRRARHTKRATLASSESLSSLSSVFKQAPLASSESLSSLSSASNQSSRQTKESLNNLPSTSTQALHRRGTPASASKNEDSTIPTKMSRSAEVHCHTDAEDPDEMSSCSQSHGQRPRKRQVCSLPHNLSNGIEEDPEGPADDIKPKCDDCKVEKGLKSADGESLKRIQALLNADQDDSTSTSDDTLPANAKFSEKILHPSYIPKIDKCCRIIFPLIFLVFNIIYWFIHLM